MGIAGQGESILFPTKFRALGRPRGEPLQHADS